MGLCGNLAEWFIVSTVFIRFTEPEISVGLRVCRDANETRNAEVALFVGNHTENKNN